MADWRQDGFRLDVPCDEHAPAAVRHALSETPETSWAIGDAMLVASELVTNAVQHSDCAGEHQIQVSVDMRADHLVIAVVDPGLSGHDAQIRPDPSIGGYGLRVVSQLARRWGSERTNGYRVWAEVALEDAV